MADPELKQRFVELRATGHSFSSIAEELGVAKSTLIAWSKELADEVHNLRSIETDALQQKYYVMRHGRITLLGQQLETVKSELAKRDLSSVPTEKLFDLLSRFSAALKQEEAPTTFKGQESIFSLSSEYQLAEWQA
jgi:transposase-like protein